MTGTLCNWQPDRSRLLAALFAPFGACRGVRFQKGRRVTGLKPGPLARERVPNPTPVLLQNRAFTLDAVDDVLLFDFGLLGLLVRFFRVVLQLGQVLFLCQFETLESALG